MKKIVFVISKGFEKAGGATRAMQFAGLAAEKGAPVEVVLVDDAVHWAQVGMAQGIRSTTGEKMEDMLQKVLDAGCPVHVCKACADKRLLSEDDLVTGSVITGGPAIVELMIDPQSKVLTF